MPEPMVQFPPTTGYRPFTRAHLRRRYGPSNPLYEILETLIGVDVLEINDDFLYATTLPTDLWTVTNNGTGAANFVASVASSNGIALGDAGTDDNGDARMISASTPYTANRRPTVLGRLGQNSAVASSKFEFGFIDAAGAGAVLVKDTPTSTRTDYAVIIRDTDDDTNVGLVTDGGTDAVGLVASSGSTPTHTTQTWYTYMLALNENRECAFYIDGGFAGIRRAGPDATVRLGIWFYVQDRDDADNRTLSIDWVKAWQERVPFSGNAFTT